VTLRCDLTQKALGVESLFLTEFDSAKSILYTGVQDPDGGGILKHEVSAALEILEYSNECDNLFHFELSGPELAVARSAIQAGAAAGTTVTGTVSFWLYADEENAASSAVTCTVDSGFERILPGSSTSGN
jgi:hypothetical protein